MTSSPIHIEHAGLGKILASEEEVFHFPGLPGFPTATRFVARRHDRESIFAWLVCLDLPDLALPITDPWGFVPDYAPAIEPRHLSAVEHRDGDAVQVFAIARIEGGAVDLNLAAPLLIDLRSRRGLQLILETDRYAPRTRVVEAEDCQTTTPADARPVRSSRSPRDTEATATLSRGRSVPSE